MLQDRKVTGPSSDDVTEFSSSYLIVTAASSD
jgi:hypothetical protein